MARDLAPDAGSWLGRQLADLSVPRAAVVGVLTHLPGLFYIAALNAITNSTSSVAGQIFQVAVYNAFWFALPTAALVLATRRPVELQDFLRRLTGLVSRHEREILIDGSRATGNLPDRQRRSGTTALTNVAARADHQQVGVRSARARSRPPAAGR